MARTKTPAASPPVSTSSYVLRTSKQRLRSWFPLVWKFAVFYGAWFLAAYVVHAEATSSAAVELAAVAFWFGVIFATLTVLFGVGMALVGVVGDVRHPIVR